MKKQIRKILEQTRGKIDRVLGATYWLHIGDLLTPCEGNITAGQLMTAARVLDISSIYAGGMPTWQNIITDAVYGKKRSESDRERANQKFISLVNSMDLRGFNPSISRCSIADHPIVLNNGTHRLGWCVHKLPNAYIPCVRDRHDLAPWFPIDGNSFFDSILDPRSLVELETAFHQIIHNQIRTKLTAYTNIDREKEIMCMRYGINGYDEQTQKEIADSMNISQSYISRLEKKILHKQ